jgi:hypothetical protein
MKCNFFDSLSGLSICSNRSVSKLQAASLYTTNQTPRFHLKIHKYELFWEVPKWTFRLLLVYGQFLLTIFIAHASKRRLIVRDMCSRLTSPHFEFRIPPTSLSNTLLQLNRKCPTKLAAISAFKVYKTPFAL